MLSQRVLNEVSIIDMDIFTKIIIYSNLIIAVTYFVIPMGLMYLAYERKDLYRNKLFYLFSLFILFCGLTHLGHVIHHYYPITFQLSIVHLLTALISSITAALLWILIPTLKRYPMLDEIRKKNGMLLKEISKRRYAEEKVRALNTQLEERVLERTNEIEFYTRQMSALYNSPVIGVVHSDATGTITNANQAFLDMIGYRQSDIKKGIVTWDILTPKKFSKIQKKAMHDMAEKGVVAPYGREYIRKDRSVIYVILGGTLLNEHTKESVSFAVDISERKKFEIRKDEFMGIASHELKTPLTSIKGYIQLLERILLRGNDQKAIELINKANQYTYRLDKLITDLLNVSRIQSGKLVFDREVFDIHPFIKSCIDGLQQTTESHTITIVDNKHAFVFADKNRIEQVIANLVSNAIKYSPDEKKVDISVTKNESEIVVAVKDYGIGIARDKTRHLFERFYRVEETSKQFSGMGVGLYISNEIIRRHKGRMWVQSKPGLGSTFYFSLPHANKSAKL